MFGRPLAFAIALGLIGCNERPVVPPDAGRMDAGGSDAGTNDAASGIDAGGEDAGPFDAGPMDDAGVDSGTIDSGMIDSGMIDAGTVDGGPVCVPPAGPSPYPGCNPTLGIHCDGNWAGRCTPACTATECCSPQGNRFRCVPKNTDGTCPAADLWVDSTRLSPYIERRTFNSTSCEIVEGCVGGTGQRRLLRFDTWTPNTGGADMYLGNPSGSSYFEYSSCHMHYHFNTYAQYELLTSDQMCVAATGHKQAFCLLDYYNYPCDSNGTNPDPAIPDCSRINGGYTCSNQGIRRDAQDVYDGALDCQWIDITDVPPGDYVIRVRINTEHILNEASYANNEVRVPVTIPP
jgi:hypothetical protein